MDLSLADNKLFFGPKHNIYTFFMILIGFLIQYKYLSVKLVMWIVKQKIENKRNLVKKLNLFKRAISYLFFFVLVFSFFF